jgi:hypothetical protein
MVYRVSRGPVNTWGIYAGPAREPFASFNDKSTAVRYAMRLARGQVSWPSVASAAAALASPAAALASPAAALASPVVEGLTQAQTG